MTSDYAQEFAQAVAREINAERGRQSGGSIRAFTRDVGSTNHTSWTHKLTPHSAQFVPMTTIDLALCGRALNIEPSELLRRAEEAVTRSTAKALTSDIERGTAAYRRGAASADVPPEPQKPIKRVAKRPPVR